MNPVKDSDYPILKKLRNAVIAHRAAAKSNAKNPNARAPENTLEAFDDARRVIGVNSVEFDVRCTMDGIPVVFHDEVLGKTLNVSPEDHGKGVKDFTFNQLRKMTFLAEHTGASSSNAYVPSLEEVVLRCKALGLNMMIEVKPFMSRRNCEAIVDIILKNDVTDICYIASFDPRVLYYVRKFGLGRICTGYLFAASAVDALAAETARQGRPSSDSSSTRRRSSWVPPSSCTC
jgi:glycerophosphoryl diester phosphodiesterase